LSHSGWDLKQREREIKGVSICILKNLFVGGGFVFGGFGILTQDIIFTRQALCHLNHILSLFSLITLSR
jgi:hypothetical protein